MVSGCCKRQTNVIREGGRGGGKEEGHTCAASPSCPDRKGGSITKSRTAPSLPTDTAKEGSEREGACRTATTSKEEEERGVSSKGNFCEGLWGGGREGRFSVCNVRSVS
jgi:hypothetical protein